MYSLIRKFRKAKNLYQKDLSRITGICESTIAKYELNSHHPTTENAIKIAEAFGCEVSDFAIISSDYRVIGNKIDTDKMNFTPRAGKPID